MANSFKIILSVIFFCLICLFSVSAAVFADRPVLRWLYQKRLEKISKSEIEKNQLGPNNFVFTLRWGRQERTYYVHVPPSYENNKPAALLIVFHGGGGSYWSVRNESRMDAKSDTDGFLVVYPSAPASVRKWNTGPRVNMMRDGSTADDIGFINAMLDDLEKRFSIDANRIYATGISNGGMMTYRVACELSDRIAAIAPVATALMNYPCHPERPVSVMHFHGKADKLVPYNGGPMDISMPSSIRILDQMRSARESIGYWVQYDQCPGTPHITYQQGEVTCETYGPGAQGSEVTLCTVENGGHTWPGGSTGLDSPLYNKLVGKVTSDISANDAMWEFFRKHPKR